MTTTSFSRLHNKHFLHLISAMYLHGYDGTFSLYCSDPRITGKGSVDYCAELLLRQAGQDKPVEFSLQSDWIATDNRSSLAMTLRMVYDHQRGFRIKFLHLDSSNGSSLAIASLPLRDLPAFRQLETLIKPRPGRIARWLSAAKRSQPAKFPHFKF